MEVKYFTQAMIRSIFTSQTIYTMKQKINFLLISALTFLLISKFAIGQVPNTFPYQAVARNASGNIIANQLISVRFGIIDSVINGPIIYTETHNITTNSLGLFTVNIGQGMPFFGTYNSVNWSKNSKFLSVALDPNGGNSYFVMGTSQLMSVPYALHSNTTASLPNGTANGNTPYWNGTKWVNDDDNIYNNGSFVGIGTNSPSYKLDVLHYAGVGIRVKAATGYSALDIDGNNSDAALRLQNAGSTKWNFRNVPSTNNLQILRNNSASLEAFTIENATGFIGINNGNPNEQLDIIGNAKISGSETLGGNLIVDGTKGIVRSDNATQLKTILYSGPLSFSLGAGGSTSFGIGYSSFSGTPTISVGNLSGTMVHPEFLLFTIRNATATSATVDVYNSGNTTASLTSATFRAMIIGPE